MRASVWAITCALALAGALGCGGGNDGRDGGRVDGSAGGCEIVECIRPVQCAATCGGPILSVGCCPCPPGQVDVDITCMGGRCEDTPGCVTVCEGGECSCQCDPVDGGGSADGGTTDGGAADACTPITNDSSAIDRDCSDGTACPTGYTCQGFSGAIFTQSCQILCDADCQCPIGIPGTCTEITDKAATWRQCVIPKI